MQTAKQTRPLIIFAGMSPDAPPAWVAQLRERLGDRYSFAHLIDRERVVSRLTDDHAALILVDGDGDDPQFWTATPKASPATRRIPVFVVSANADQRSASLLQGADLALSPNDIIKDAPRLIKEFARVPDHAVIKQLDCECFEPLPELARQGVEKFNAGEFYKQHDLFEELWMATDSPVRDLYRAILQVGIAYFQILRGNHRGARKMLLRSVQWLNILPDTCQGVDVRALREDSARVRAVLETLPEAEIDQFDKTLLQPVKLIQAE